MDIEGGGGIISTAWVADNAILVPNAAGFTSISNLKTFKKRVGDSLYLRGSFTMNSGAAASANFGLVGVTIDLAKIPGNANTIKLMDMHRLSNTNGAVYIASIGLVGFCDGTTNSKIFITDQLGNTPAQFDKVNVSAFAAAGNAFTFETLGGGIPITGWTQS